MTCASIEIGHCAFLAKIYTLEYITNIRCVVYSMPTTTAISRCGPANNSFWLWFSFLLITVDIFIKVPYLLIFFHCSSFSIRNWGFLKLDNLGSAIAFLQGRFLPLEYLLEYWIQHVTIGRLFYVKIVLYSQLRCTTGEFQAFQPVVLALFWLRGLTTSLLYIGARFGNIDINST